MSGDDDSEFKFKEQSDASSSIEIGSESGSSNKRFQVASAHDAAGSEIEFVVEGTATSSGIKFDEKTASNIKFDQETATSSGIKFAQEKPRGKSVQQAHAAEAPVPGRAQSMPVTQKQDELNRYLDASVALVQRRKKKDDVPYERANSALASETDSMVIHEVASDAGSSADAATSIAFTTLTDRVPDNGAVALHTAQPDCLADSAEALRKKRLTELDQQVAAYQEKCRLVHAKKQAQEARLAERKKQDPFGVKGTRGDGRRDSRTHAVSTRPARPVVKKADTVESKKPVLATAVKGQKNAQEHTQAVAENEGEVSHADTKKVDDKKNAKPKPKSAKQAAGNASIRNTVAKLKNAEAATSSIDSAEGVNASFTGVTSSKEDQALLTDRSQSIVWSELSQMRAGSVAASRNSQETDYNPDYKGPDSFYYHSTHGKKVADRNLQKMRDDQLQRQLAVLASLPKVKVNEVVARLYPRIVEITKPIMTIEEVREMRIKWNARYEATKLSLQQIIDEVSGKALIKREKERKQKQLDLVPPSNVAGLNLRRQSDASCASSDRKSIISQTVDTTVLGQDEAQELYIRILSSTN